MHRHEDIPNVDRYQNVRDAKKACCFQAALDLTVQRLCVAESDIVEQIMRDGVKRRLF